MITRSPVQIARSCLYDSLRCVSLILLGVLPGSWACFCLSLVKIMYSLKRSVPETLGASLL